MKSRVAMKKKRPGALGVLKLEEQAAWDEYLDTTRECSEYRYLEVEPWAWNRLGGKLRAIHARRRAILEEDGA